MSLVYGVGGDGRERGNRNSVVGVAACYFVRMGKELGLFQDRQGTGDNTVEALGAGINLGHHSDALHGAGEEGG